MKKIIRVGILFIICLFVAKPRDCHAAELSLRVNEYIYGDSYVEGSFITHSSFTYEDQCLGSAINHKCYAIINGKRYNAKLTEDSFGYDFKIKIPRYKIGTKIQIFASAYFPLESYSEYAKEMGWNHPQNVSDKATIKIKNIDSELRWFNYSWVKAKTRKIKVTWDNIQKTDVIKIKIGKKVYSKKVKNNKTVQYVNIKLSKAGTKLTIWIENKFKQRRSDKYTDVVYSNTGLKVGMTKAQARLVAGWRYPDDKNYYTYDEQWCYDDDGDGIHDSYLYFNNKGRLTGWSY